MQEKLVVAQAAATAFLALAREASVFGEAPAGVVEETRPLAPRAALAAAATVAREARAAAQVRPRTATPAQRRHPVAMGATAVVGEAAPLDPAREARAVTARRVRAQAAVELLAPEREALVELEATDS